MQELLVNQKKVIVTFVDDCDADICEGFATSGVLPTGHVFFRTTGRKGTYTFLHRLICGRMLGRPLTRAEVVDHIDHNPLNNQRENLRICSQGQNILNQVRRYNSLQKGYAFDPHRKKWKVYLTFQGTHYQKRFRTELEAAVYARILRDMLHGVFANHGAAHTPP